MKKKYTEPEILVLQSQLTQMLCISKLESVSTNLNPEDDLELSEEEAGNGFWGR